MLKKDKMFKVPFYVRLASRIVANFIMGKEFNSYQVSGKIHLDLSNLKEDHADIQMPKEQLVHWVLRTCGHSVSVMSVLEHYGRKKDKKQ